MAMRLRPLTDETPKCLLHLDKKPILYYTLKNLILNKISDVVIVTGFKREKIESYVKQDFPDLKVTFVYNKDYEKTNNAYSLLLAESVIKGNFILLDSDIIFHPDIIKTLAEYPKKPVLAVNSHECGEEEIKVLVDSEKKILEISKSVKPHKAWGESIGIELFSKKEKETLFKVLKKRISQEKRVNEFYEASFEEMIQQGHPFYAEEVTHFPAMEIDFAEDFEKAKTMVKKIYSSVK